jgi:DNA ligase D-like protein (predicted ligase)
MKEREWLLEKVEKSQVDWLVDPVNPMLAESHTKIPAGDDYIFEVKWDGIRTLISLDEGILQFHTRNQNEVSRQFPELQIASQAFRATTGLFDAEIVCLDQEGKPEFKRIINRLMTSDELAIQTLSEKNPVHCYLFDCLYLDGRPIINEPLLKRKEWLEDSVRKGTPYRISEFVKDGEGLFEAARKYNLEGIMAKKKGSHYKPGKRSNFWLKIKIRKTADCLVIGYTEGKGDRRPYFGALHLAEQQNGKLQYRGKVGTGFNDTDFKQIVELLEDIPTISKPIDNKVMEESKTTWIKPVLVVEVTYASLTADKIFREAVYIRLRPDKSVLNLKVLTAK